MSDAVVGIADVYLLVTEAACTVLAPHIFEKDTVHLTQKIVRDRPAMLEDGFDPDADRLLRIQSFPHIIGCCPASLLGLVRGGDILIASKRVFYVTGKLRFPSHEGTYEYFRIR